MPTQSEKLNPLHRLLKFSSVYQAVQNTLIKKTTLSYLYQEFPKISASDRVLDLGCGPAKLRHWVRAKQYVGIDFNPLHINEARKNHPTDTFICGDIVTHFFGDETFDKILMMGVLHHLNDVEAKSVLAACQKALAEGGKIITSDPLIEKGQNPIARLLARMDQGNYVRTREGYLTLVTPLFNQVKVEVKTDLLRVPYTHHLMTIQQ